MRFREHIDNDLLEQPTCPVKRVEIKVNQGRSFGSWLRLEITYILSSKFFNKFFEHPHNDSSHARGADIRFLKSRKQSVILGETTNDNPTKR